jgi:hypothetical protein
MDINAKVRWFLNESSANITPSVSPVAPIGGANLIISDIYPSSNSETKKKKNLKILSIVKK